MNIFESDESGGFEVRDNSIVILDGLEAVQDNAESEVLTLQGENIYDTLQGMPNFDTVWRQSPNVIQFEINLFRVLLAVSGVTDVRDFSAQIVDDVLFYQVTIETDQENIVIDSTIPAPIPDTGPIPALFDSDGFNMTISNENLTASLENVNQFLPDFGIARLNQLLTFEGTQLFGFYFTLNLSTFQTGEIFFVGFTNQFNIDLGGAGANSIITAQFLVGDTSIGQLQVALLNPIGGSSTGFSAITYNPGDQLCIATDGTRIALLHGNSGVFADDLVFPVFTPGGLTNNPVVMPAYLVNQSPPVNQADTPSSLSIIPIPVEYSEIDLISSTDPDPDPLPAQVFRSDIHPGIILSEENEFASLDPVAPTGASGAFIQQPAVFDGTRFVGIYANLVLSTFEDNSVWVLGWSNSENESLRDSGLALVITVNDAATGNVTLQAGNIHGNIATDLSEAQVSIIGSTMQICVATDGVSVRVYAGNSIGSTPADAPIINFTPPSPPTNTPNIGSWYSASTLTDRTNTSELRILTNPVQYNGVTQEHTL